MTETANERRQKTREFNKLLERSSLSHKNLYAECPRCGNEQARDPFDTRKCVAGHWLPKGAR